MPPSESTRIEASAELDPTDPVPPPPDPPEQRPPPPPRPEPPRPKLDPDYSSPDIVDNINITENSSTSSGLKFLIDVIPDSRNIIKSIIFHVIPSFINLDVKDSPLISPLSIVFYLLTMIYAHLLFSDYNFRKPMSKWASDFMSNPLTVRLYETMITSHVPPFIKTILMGLNNATDSRRPKISYIASLASYDFQHDTGRLIPPSLFLQAHNIISTMSARTDPADVNDLFHSQVSVTHGPPPVTTIRTGNLLGTNLNDGIATYTFTNWFNESIQSLFNPPCTLR